MRFLIALIFAVSPALADSPVIEKVTASGNGGSWNFSVTLSHGDTGWDDYADGWRVLDMQGNELGLRVLYHPHVDEQPFTRSQSGIQIPTEMTQVQIQARDLIGGWAKETVILDLDNPNYTR